MIEDRFLPDLSVQNPVQALHDVSRDVTCTREIALADGRRVNAVQLQWEYLEHAKKYVEREDDTPENREIVDRWESCSGRSRPIRRPCTASSTGSRSSGCSRPTANGTVWRGATRSCARSICSTTMCAVTRACTTAWRPPGKVERLTTDQEVDEAVMEPPDRHPCVLPRPLHRQVPRRHRGGFVGLADRGHRAGCPAAHPDAGTAPRHQGPRR